MIEQQTKAWQVNFCRGSDDRDLIHRIQRFRHALFVERLRWDLPVCDGVIERDEFDRADTIHAALIHDGDIVGCFRAIRADRPYLSRTLFPLLAAERPYPTAPHYWEISRFGVWPEAPALAARLNYAAMFRFAFDHNARGLVALADLTYERFLRILGIRTVRYGTPRTIGHDLDGRPIVCVAGEIPLSAQHGRRFAALSHLAHDLEIIDETLVLGRDRLSA